MSLRQNPHRSQGDADSEWDEPDASDDPDWVPGPGLSSGLELESDPDIQLQSATPVISCMEGRNQGVVVIISSLVIKSLSYPWHKLGQNIRRLLNLFEPGRDLWDPLNGCDSVVIIFK